MMRNDDLNQSFYTINECCMVNDGIKFKIA